LRYEWTGSKIKTSSKIIPEVRKFHRRMINKPYDTVYICVCHVLFVGEGHKSTKHTIISLCSSSADDSQNTPSNQNYHGIRNACGVICLFTADLDTLRSVLETDVKHYFLQSVLIKRSNLVSHPQSH